MHRVTAMKAMAAGFVLSGAIAAPASAQNALGDGHALDRNLDPATGGRNAAQRPIDFNARNLVITRNVVGGRGFRESVGYLSADEFRGALPSDEQYQFRAGSAWSSVNFANYGETYQRLRFGQDAGLLEYRRTGQGATIRSIEEQIYRPGDVVKARLRVDRFSRASSISAASRNAIEPTIIGGFIDEDGTARSLQVSSLRGLFDQSIDQMTAVIGISSYDRAVLRDEYEKRPEDLEDDELGRQFERRYADLRTDRRVDRGERRVDAIASEDRRVNAQVSGRALEPGRVPDFRRIREQVASRYERTRRPADAEAEPSSEGSEMERLASLDDDLRSLRARLAGVAGIDEDLAAIEASRGDTESTGQRLGTDLGSTDLMAETADEPAPEKPPIERYGEILRHGQRIDQLASPEATSRFNQLVASGEEALREGRYFWAEQRFARALRFIPGEPMATAGLAHTQIGAGLYLSASLTLRSLFEFQPEMIDAKYDPALVPNRPRLLRAVTTLEQRLEGGRDIATSAFVLAYIGRLLGDRTIVRSALDAMEAAAPDDEMVPLLKAIWLAPESATAPGSTPEVPAAEPEPDRTAAEPEPVTPTSSP
ncbi:MAG: hypothetical protein GY715_19215 [Planctomycetes bacterium]|nr:hypothetical protein [Planctomycetota bacterium]